MTRQSLSWKHLIPGEIFTLPAWMVWLLLGVFILCLCIAPDSWAQSFCGPKNYECVDPPLSGLVPIGPGTSGLVTGMMENIRGFLDLLGKQMYEKIIQSPEFSGALRAVVVLFIAIYGIQIALDLENFTPAGILLRIFKVAIVWWISDPTAGGGWTIFRDTIGKFFWGGMMELVELFTAVTISSGTIGGSPTAADLAAPLHMLDQPMANLFSGTFYITVMGLAFTGLKGLAFALLVMWAGGTLLMSVFRAVFNYTKAMVGLWFMFAMAPLFFILMLFQHTRPMFEGWLTVVIKFTLEVVLLFIFLQFFMSLVTTAMEPIMGIKWCWSPIAHTVLWVIDFDIWFWRAAELNYGATILGECGTLGWFEDGYNHNPAIPFPLEVIDILFFMLCAHVAMYYSSFVETLATAVVQGGLTLGTSAEDANNYARSEGWTIDKIAGKGWEFVSKEKR